MSTIRELKSGGCISQPRPVAIEDGLRSWLEEQARQHGLTTLLAHADDGVIWGRVDEAGSLQLSSDTFPDVSPALCTVTLQEARLFGPLAEIHLWTGSGGWQASLTEDTPGSGEYYDEIQILWGNTAVMTREGFTLVRDGQQGLRHAVPMPVPAAAFSNGRHPLRLRTRHYLTVNPENGLLQVVLSRLVEVMYVANTEEGRS